MGGVEGQLEEPFFAATIPFCFLLGYHCLSFSAASASCCWHKFCVVVLISACSTLTSGGYYCDSIKVTVACQWSSDAVTTSYVLSCRLAGWVNKCQVIQSMSKVSLDHCPHC